VQISPVYVSGRFKLSRLNQLLYLCYRNFTRCCHHRVEISCSPLKTKFPVVSPFHAFTIEKSALSQLSKICRLPFSNCLTSFPSAYFCAISGRSIEGRYTSSAGTYTLSQSALRYEVVPPVRRTAVGVQTRHSPLHRRSIDLSHLTFLEHQPDTKIVHPCIIRDTGQVLCPLSDQRSDAVSGMPHRPNPPSMSVAPSVISLIASSGPATTLLDH
jgi:hypothetical protein